MADLTLSELRSFSVCSKLYAIRHMGMRSKSREKRLITRNCISSLVTALSNGDDYIRAVDEAIDSIQKDFFKHSCEEEAMKMKLGNELHRIGDYLVGYIGSDTCSSGIGFSFQYGKTICGHRIDNITGVADLVIDRGQYVEAVLIRSGKPIESSAARTGKNKPANSVLINAAYIGISSLYPEKDVKVSLFYLTSKKDDKKNDCLADYESTNGSNIVSVSYPAGAADNLQKSLLIDREAACKNCDQSMNCQIRPVRAEEELQFEESGAAKAYDYTDSQKMVIEHVDGAMYVEAVPGAGKTAVLTERCCTLVGKGIKPENILCVTFTNKARDEIKIRLAKKGCEDVNVGTFNSLGYDILRECSSFVGDVRLAEEVDKKPLIEKALSDCYNNGIRIAGANYGVLQGGDYCLVNLLCKKIDSIENYGIDNYLENRAGKEDTENTLKVYEYYKELLKAGNYIYYDEQISKAVELFVSKPNILKMYQNRFKYIMIDEFQDVNASQFEMVQLLAGQRHNIVCVGDSDQSIYSWRGGDPGFALRFKDYFPEAQIVLMTDNYRCTESIAYAANTLIGHNTDRYQKNIIAHKDGMPVWFYDLKNSPSDIGVIMGSILKKYKPGEIAIICRKNSSLDKFGLSLDPSGSLTSKNFLIDDAVFLSIRDLFILLDEPSNDEALYRLLIRCGADRKAFFDVQLKDKSLAAYLLAVHFNCNEVLKAAFSKISKALVFLRDSDDFYEDGILEGVLSGMVNILFGFDNHPVIQIIVDKAAERVIKTKSELLFYMSSLVNYSDSSEVSYREADDRFNLITAHGSKGKEFPCVVVYGVDAFEPTPEERRLLYVSMTRAKESLFIIKNMDSENMVEEFRTCCHEAFLRRKAV